MSENNDGGNLPSQTGFESNRPTIIALLYIFGFVTGLSAIAGVVLAYVWRKEPGVKGSWQSSHFTYLIRTFWIGFVASLVSCILIFIVIGLPMLFAVAIWTIVRSAVAINLAQKHKPIADPEGWWI